MSIATTEHTVRAFDAELHALTRMMSELGGHAESQIIWAVDALVKRDLDRGKRVVRADAGLDHLQCEIEQRAIELIATRQPMAVDLREIIAILRIVRELERVGDLAKNIGKRVAALGSTHLPRQPLRGLMHMSTLAAHQLKDALDSHAARDSRKAMNVWRSDEEVDSLYTSLFRELLTYIMEDPGIVVSGLHLLFCAKNLERVGDHATNIAESVYYLVEGRSLGDERPKVDPLAAVAFTLGTPSTAPVG
jgi:phosphate transport system protein